MGLLRILLAVSVLTTHAHTKAIFGFRLVPGYLAVQCFFMVSGFYMALVLNEKYDKPGDYRLFLRQRLLRIFPPYLIIVAIYLVFFGVTSFASGVPLGFLADWTRHSTVLDGVDRAVLTFVNLTLIGVDYLPFLSFDPASSHLVVNWPHQESLTSADTFLVLLPAWSLGAELTFYLIAPFLVRRCIRLQVALLGVCIALRWITWLGFHLKPDDLVLSRLFPYQLGFFVAGSVAYWVYRHHQARLERICRTQRWLFWIFPIFLICFSRLPHSHHLYWILFPAVFAMLPILFYATKRNVRDRMLGELSYPFYLGHLLFIAAIDAIAQGHWWKDLYGPAYLFSTLAFSYLFYRTIEVRTETFRATLFALERVKEGMVAEPSALPPVKPPGQSRLDNGGA